MMFTRRGFLAGTGAVLTTMVLPVTGAELWQIEGSAFGAGWRIRVPAHNADPKAIVAAVTGVVDAVNNSMSPFLAGSEISIFNRSQTIDWLPLSPPIIRTIQEARRIASQTSGSFDPTLGGVVGRYGFGPISGLHEGNFSDMVVGPDAVRKSHPRQTLDLCGIAKGYALDQSVAALKSIGITNFFIEMGGEVCGFGQAPEGQPWRAGIEAPTGVPGEIRCVVALPDVAIATSGSIVNSYAFAAHRYGHIIDPSTMLPADGSLLSVSVLGTHATTADALATALFAMGPERGVDFASNAEIDAFFIAIGPLGLSDTVTGRFADRIIGA